MKKTLLAACCLLPVFSHAQNGNLDFHYALKGSGTFTHASDGPYYTLEGFQANTIKPSVSLLIKNRCNNFHEIEITDAYVYHTKNINNPQFSGSYITSNLTLRYQYVQNFLKRANSRWMPSIAFGLTASTTFSKYKEYAYYEDTWKDLELDLTGTIAPQISYSFSKKFFMTFSVPITIADSYSWFGIGSSGQDNELQAFPSRWSLKLGLGLKL